jgi:membrane protein DedA with SNARE-associated domain/rhodanese-related sulfurtransferase
MPELLQFLFKHGYIVLFGATLVEQLGFPIPAATLLIAMGALSRSGEFALLLVVAAGATAALAADLTWYELGRVHGRSVLQILCRISLEPDYCVRRTEDTFERLGLWTLLPAKFVPGLNAAAVPMAGMMKTPFVRFLAVDIPSVVLWSSAYVLAGYAFSQQIERIIIYLSRLGALVGALIAVAVAIYVGYKIDHRRRFLKTLAGSRITAEQLKAKMDAKEKILILDLRNRLDRNTDPVRIPGAFHVLPQHLEFQPQDLAGAEEIVLYCTCPNEATSARAATHLRRKGVLLARPLLGGLDAWKEQGLPLEFLD